MTLMNGRMGRLGALHDWPGWSEGERPSFLSNSALVKGEQSVALGLACRWGVLRLSRTGLRVLYHSLSGFTCHGYGMPTMKM